ncbi:hypothetical protein C0991_005207 [Blastosporella zonata]|nr:hypothetical protein C0991_005207 [Blastosporella zonata]
MNTNFKPKYTQDDWYFSDRLAGQDDRLDKLSTLFEQLQLATVETSQPTLDLLTFSETAFFFSVIIKKPTLTGLVPTVPSSSIAKNKKPKLSIPNRYRNKRKTSMFPTVKIESHGNQLPTEEETAPKPKRSRPSESTSPQAANPEAKTIEFIHLFDQKHPNENEWKRWADYSNLHTTEEAGVKWQENVLVHDDIPIAFPTEFKFGREEGEGEVNGWMSNTVNVRWREEEVNKGWTTNTTNGGWEKEKETVNDSEPVDNQDEAIGFVYLVDLATFTDDPLRAGELNIGIILDPAHRGKGYARQAIDMVLDHAFLTGRCHRVQAILPDHVAKDRAICLFTQLRFDHEGTRRRAFYSPIEHVYKDVTYMGLLDTDWLLRNTEGVRARMAARPAPKSVWDELFARHQREREELLNWQDSLMTPRAQTPTQSDFKMCEEAEENANVGGESSIVAPRFIERQLETEEKIQVEESMQVGHESDPFASSSESEFETESTRSASPGGYVSAASSSMSAWDVVDTSDSDYESSVSSPSSDSAVFEFVGSPSQ